MKSSAELPVSCVVNGVAWDLYGVDYETADGKFSTYIYAVSFEHAAAIVEELKQTATLSGKIEGFIENRS